MQRKQRNLLILGALSCAIGLFAILGVVQTNTYFKVSASSQDINNSQKNLASIGGAFELVDKDRKTWKDTDFKGKPMLVYFGYSYCPDVCPMALSHLTEAVEALGGGKTIQPVFITLDPERDTPENLQVYSKNFHKDLLLLTGSQAQIDQAVKAYKVHAARTSEDKDAEYLVDHSSLIYLMKDGKYLTHFDHQTPSEEIVKKVNAHIN